MAFLLLADWIAEVTLMLTALIGTCLTMMCAFTDGAEYDPSVSPFRLLDKKLKYNNDVIFLSDNEENFGGAIRKRQLRLVPDVYTVVGKTQGTDGS